jgi:hypothetical protein
LSKEPDLKAPCKAQDHDSEEKDLNALGECVEAKLRNAWEDGRDGKISIPLHATTVPVTEACPAIDVQDIESLRDRLKRRLAEANVGDSDDDTPDQPPPAPTQQSAQTEPSPAAPADTGSDDDPFCAFIARKAVRGELTPEGGARIPDYCRSAMDKAKSCAEQKCSMADIIGREERDNSRPLFHWGADDYQAIEALQK